MLDVSKPRYGLDVAVEECFMASSSEFLALAQAERYIEDIALFRAGAISRPTRPVAPTVLRDYRNLSESERGQIAEQFRRQGVAHFIVENPDDPPLNPHPLFDVCEQLSDELHLKYPLRHPLEGHPEAATRFGPCDDTVKIYNLPKPVGGASYREVAESSDAFEVHLDGLGSGGSVESVVLYMDQAPLFGGFTFFYDMLALGLSLAFDDPEAFRSLFLPDTFIAIRPRGKGAIKVTSPVFYINEQGRPQVFFRKNSGEYRMIWREDKPELKRARTFLERYTSPFCPGSMFVPFSRRGCGCISRNRDIAHGRIAFVDGDRIDARRVLSRKWFMKTEKDAVYKHVPGTAIRADLASLLPGQFGENQIAGEWLYDEATDVNNLKF